MMNILIQNQNVSCSSEVPNSMWIPSSSTLDGPKIMANYENSDRGAPEFQLLYRDENEEDYYDGSYNSQGKKRRLSENQVQFLEKNFQFKNKLEPERKVRLAKESGLQPRQVAIWFQNRRARLKNKQLGMDYDSLKSNYDELNNNYDNLLKEKQHMENQIETLKEKLLNREKGKQSCNFVQIGAIDSSNLESRGPIFYSVTETASNLQFLGSKPEETSSGKKVVFNSESPIYTDRNNFLSIEPADSSNVFETEQSEEEDNFRIPIENSSCFGFAIVDQSLWSSFY